MRLRKSGMIGLALLICAGFCIFSSCGEDSQKSTGAIEVNIPATSERVSRSSQSSEKSLTTGSTSEISTVTTLGAVITAESSVTPEVSTSDSASEAESEETTNPSSEIASVLGGTEKVDPASVSEVLGSTSPTDSDLFYNDIRIADPADGILILVNKKYRLPDGFEQEDLVDIPSNYHVTDGKEYKMYKEAAEAFYDMSDAAWNESEGRIDLRVISGYRSHSYQIWLYNHYADTYGKSEADSYSARPRHSEHETGLCCDIDMVDTNYENTENFKWLMENAADYGFILRYEKGKEHITGYIYEPWHWRYVGVETAKAVKESGLTYDEFYLKYIGTDIE